MSIPSNKNWNELNAYKASWKLTQQQREMLVGGLLGDFSLRKIGKHSRLVLEQKNKEYLFHLYDIFKDFVRTPPKERLQQRLTTSAYKSTWYFSTISHSEFDDFYNLYYPNGKKIIPSCLNQLLTPCGIAYWFMDDGTNNKSYYAFATASFSVEEHNLLLDILQTKFNLVCTVQRKQSPHKTICVSAINDSNKNLRKLIEPYIVPSMKYKL